LSSSLPLLIRAAADGDTETVRRLIARGVDLNSRTGGGQTALMLAVIGGHEKVVRILRTAGADPRLRDRLGLTVFDWAERRGFHELAKLFEEECGALGSPEQPSAANTEMQQRAEPEHQKERLGQSGDRSQRWLSGMKQRWQEEMLRQNAALAASSSKVENASAATEPRPEVRSTTIAAAVARDKRESESIPKVETHSPEPAERQPILPQTPRVSERPSVSVKTQPAVRVPISEDRSDYVSDQTHPEPIATPYVETATSTPKSSNRRFIIWFSFAFLLAIACIGTYFLFRFLSSVTQPEADPVVAQPTPEPVIESRNLPVLSEELVGKELNLLEPEYPARARSRKIGGTVVVRVRVNKRGRVVLARSSAGDWQLRSAAVNAATKSTFDPAKLAERDTQGTISYKFIP
jgi:TonB family protein